MACDHHDCSTEAVPDERYRKVLWVALIINALMFGVEIIYGLKANSSALLADSLDFLGDAANYGISLWVLGMATLVRARASLIKASTMALFGVWVLGDALWGLMNNSVPEATTMGVVGVLALIANVTVAVMLYAWREGDSNMRSVWLCSRNDAIGNIAVMLAALGVLGTQSGLPDFMVAVVMASLALSASYQIIKQARSELAQG
ncbi:cation transporter [Thiofilum flexile]|uniref:cation transporter n=1 Tax=Thiofilum flexile TaxID=125627 RepID=UPI000381B21C|nr:cation diffusion facilitator family transporter [Thiofilum flexile]